MSCGVQEGCHEGECGVLDGADVGGERDCLGQGTVVRVWGIS